MMKGKWFILYWVCAGFALLFFNRMTSLAESLPGPSKPSTLSQEKESSNSLLPRITGTFIQYQSWMMQLDQAKWELELDAMKSAGIDTVVIQWLKSDQNYFFPLEGEGVDPTEIILKYSDKNRIKVYVGLQFDKAWWINWKHQDFLQEIENKTILLGKKILARYGKHTSFAGWYIPYEMSDSNFTKTEITYLNSFLKNLVSDLKGLSQKPYPIGVSTFFSGNTLPGMIQKAYTEILQGTGIGHLMIQDGVGVHNWYHQVQSKVVPYINAYRLAAQANGIQPWVVIESFSRNQSEHFPTDIVRLKEQLQSQAPYSNEKILTFDFFHYMSPYRGKGQKQLYESYRTQFNLLVD